MIHFPSLSSKRQMKHRMAKPRAFLGNLKKPRPQRPIAIRLRRISEDAARDADQCTGPSQAESVALSRYLDGFSTMRGPHHFRETISFSAALSSIASARSFFNFEFSASNSRARLASLTVMPP